MAVWACTTVFNQTKPILIASGQGHKIGMLTGTFNITNYNATRVTLQNAAGRTISSMFKHIFTVFAGISLTIPCQFEWIGLVGTDSLTNVTATFKAWRISTGAECVDNQAIGITPFIAFGQL